MVQDGLERKETVEVVVPLVNEDAMSLELDGDACIADLNDTHNGGATGRDLVSLPSLGKADSTGKHLAEVKRQRLYSFWL